MDKIKSFLFENSGIRQTIVKNTFWVAIGTTLTKIIRVSIIIYVARILGTEDYGIFTYALSLVAIFTIFSDIGLTSILTRELTKRTEDKREYLSTALVIKLVFILSSVILIALFAPLISKFESAKPLLMLIAITVTFESLQNFFYAITRSQNKMEVEAGLSVVTEIITTTIVLGVFLQYPTVKALAISYMIGSGLGFIITTIFLREYITSTLKYFQKKLIKPIINSSWPFAIMGVSSVFMTNIDSLIIGAYGNAHILGLYAAAQKPISLLRILPNFLGTALFPIINKFSHDKEEKKLAQLVGKSSVISLALALPIVIGGIIMAEPLIMVTFGHEFIETTLTFQILLLSLLLIFPGTAFADLILAEDKQKVFIKSSIWGSIINVGLDFLLIPTYGINGSAVATLISVIVVNIIFFREARKITRFSIFSGMKNIVLAVIVMAIFTYILKTLSVPLIVIIVLSAIVYFGLIFLMKDPIVEDIRMTFRTKREIIS